MSFGLRSGGGEAFRPILKERARGSEHLGPLAPELCEMAMQLILRGEVTPAQIGGFFLVGRAVGDGPDELAAYARPLCTLARTLEAPQGSPVLTVTGGFDGKLRTLNVGAAASLVAAAARCPVLLLGCESTPPKEGRTVFDALRGLGLPSPQTLEEAESSLVEHRFAATSAEHYLPELYALLGLRREMVRRTALNVIEKMVSPVLGSRMMVGITHRPFLRSIPEALIQLGVEHALVFQAIEGSDEAPLDGSSFMVRVWGGETEELQISPESVGLSRATKAHVPWRGPEDETRRVLDALDGEEGPVRALILYNAALRLWAADEVATPAEGVERADETLRSRAALELVGAMHQPEALRAVSF